MKNETWRITLVSAYGIAVICIVALGLIKIPIVYPLLFIPFLIYQLHRLITNPRYRVVSLMSVCVLLVAILGFLYLVLKYLT